MSVDKRSVDWRTSLGAQATTTALTEHDVEYIRQHEGGMFDHNVIDDVERVAYLEFREAARAMLAAQLAHKEASKRYTDAITKLSKAAAPQADTE